MARWAAILGRLVAILVIVEWSGRGCEGRVCHEEERRALLELKTAMKVPDDPAFPGWGNSTAEGGKDCCRWKGIKCDSTTGRVVEISVSGLRRYQAEDTRRPNLTMLAVFEHLTALNLVRYQIGGGFPEVVCHLKRLKSLNLLGNNIDASIPSCLCSLNFLRELLLSYNHLHGDIPSCLRHLTALNVLDLSNNHMEGHVPSFLCTFRSLKELHLSNNSFQGGNPSCFGSLHSLTHLSLPYNFEEKNSSWLCDMCSVTELHLVNDGQPTGIPSCLGHLHKLNFLDIRGHGFEGNIPSTLFSNLTDLTSLEIYSNQLRGTLQLSVFSNFSKLEAITISASDKLEIDTENPISWVPSFQLRNFSIAGCGVNARGNNIFPTFLSSQYTLEFVGFDSTSVTGPPPVDLFCNSTLTWMYLNRNKFFGPLSFPCRNASVHAEAIDLASNSISGLLPERIGHYFPNLDLLNLADNKIEGEIPASLGHVPLTWLDLSNNYFTGSLASTLTRNQTKMRYLNISYNHLGGELLPTNAYMPALVHLIVSNNNFMGSLLPKLSNSSLLFLIDAGHNNFADNLSQSLPYLPALSIFSLRENHVQGDLPEWLCRSKTLKLVDLSGNKLSGNIITCLQNVSSWNSINEKHDNNFLNTRNWPRVSVISKNLPCIYEGIQLESHTILDLSMNMINGIIPPEMGKLKGLWSLNLSNNHIQGSIPVEMADMISIESLDLSHNGLNGSIPHEMLKLSFLSVFSVAFNNLSGEIPDGGQLSAFPQSSFDGNPRLCGSILQKTCSRKQHEEKTAEGGEDDALFYLLVFLSFVLGFSGFLTSFLFNANWRGKYFRIIDGCSNALLRDV